MLSKHNHFIADGSPAPCAFSHTTRHLFAKRRKRNLVVSMTKEVWQARSLFSLHNVRRCFKKAVCDFRGCSYDTFSLPHYYVVVTFYLHLPILSFVRNRKWCKIGKNIHETHTAITTIRTCCFKGLVPHLRIAFNKDKAIVFSNTNILENGVYLTIFYQGVTPQILFIY